MLNCDMTRAPPEEPQKGHVRVYAVQADSLVYRTPAVTDRGLNPSFSSPLYKPLSHARDRNDIANVSCVGVSIGHRMH
jgi:hypothetical protein